MILFIWSRHGAVYPIMTITWTNMLKPCSQINFIIINLTYSISLDLNKWSFNKTIFKRIIAIQIYWMNSELKEVNMLLEFIKKVLKYLQHSNYIHIVIYGQFFYQEG